MTEPGSRPSTLDELRATGWTPRNVKDELRHNLVTRIRNGAKLFPGIVGMDGTVVPALERAILAGHDVVLLGERGQAKTRLIRSLVDLLDEAVPTIAGCEINDDPYTPICGHCRARIAEEGGATPIEWITRDDRYGEKLATPDTAVADLIGDVDPIRVAEGRYLSDELTIHFGMVPRTNRGIFSINELPDLPARIQVALFNILEERDVQIRGFRVRLPIDVMLVATANPEDYTNRGRIVTPLKDRFGSEIRTHYPLSPADEIAVMDQEARPAGPEVEVDVPEFMKEILAEFSRLARRSPHVNQRSGVSVRLSIANLEIVRASAVRRAIRLGEAKAVPRISDLTAIVQSSTGRIELETFDEGREEEVLRQILSHAVLEVFHERLAGAELADLLVPFNLDHLVVETGHDVPASSVIGRFAESPALAGAAARLGVDDDAPESMAAVLEFLLEGLHLTRRLNKDEAGRYLAGARS